MIHRLPYVTWVALLSAGLLAGCVTETPNGGPIDKPNLPEAARLNTQLGAAYAGQGQFQLAERKLKLAISEKDDYAPAYSALAYVYSQTGRPDDAERNYRHALSLSPDDPDTQNNFGVFLCAHGKSAEGQEQFRKAISNRAYGTPEAAWTNAGVCPGTSAAEAEMDFIHALQANADFAPALEQMVRLTVAEGQYARARAFEQRYRRVVPQPGPAMLLLMAKTERGLGNLDTAASYEQQIIQQYPDSVEASQLSTHDSQ